MTMQTTSLPIQAAPASPSQNLRPNAGVPNDGVNFGAALTRQIEQRQVEQRQQEQRKPQAPPQPTMAPPQAVAAPKPHAASRPAANETRAPAREAVKEASRESAAGKADAAKAPAAEEKAAAAGSDNAAEATGPEDAKAVDSVVDMLAMVASFNQVQLSPALMTPPVDTAETQPGVPFDPAQETSSLGATMLAPAAGGAVFAAVPDEQDATRAKAEPAIDLRTLEAGKSAESAGLPVEGGDFAAALRDSAAQAASSKVPPPAGPATAEPAPALQALSSLATQASALQSAQAAGSVPTDRLSARVGTPAWDNQVGQKVIWMVGGADQSATLELNPPDLGPVQVVLNVSNDMASVTFSSSQLEVRQALENALPRLREMMTESGIALGDATVNAGAEGRSGKEGDGSGRPGRGHGGGNDGDSAVADIAPRQRSAMLGGAGAVDTFA